MASRVAGSPASLTTRPIFSVLAEALEGRVTPRYLEVPKNLSKAGRAELLAGFEQAEDVNFQLLKDVELAVLSTQDAFSSLGFEAVPKGKRGKPDGIAEAHLSATKDGQRNYSVSLESKSKENPNTKVSAKTVSISAIVRQRDDFKCQHAIVVGPDFPASRDGKSALEKEIIEAAKPKPGEPARTVTLMRVFDLARLVRIQPRKRINLEQLRDLFIKCKMPEESAEWVSNLEKLQLDEPPYRDILEVIWKVQKDEPESLVLYGKLKTALRYEKNITMQDPDLKNLCHAMMGMAGGSYIFATDSTVELIQKPNKVLEAIQAVDEREKTPPQAKT